jgi:glycosyltransferase involved in cell wall biosynthesis
MARIVSSVPVVYTEHNLVDSYWLVTRLFNRLTYSRNARSIAVSDAVANSLLGYPGPPVEVVPNGVSIVVSDEERAKARSELALPDDGELVVHVGNIRPHKGHATLISAARWLADRRPQTQIISIGGEKHRGDIERVRALARKEGVERTLHFLGRRDDARAFIAASDVVVNPSDFEGLPLVLLEAMSLARPIVATAVGGVPGLIESGLTGLLVPPGDGARLGAGIEQLLSDPIKAGEMARTGRDEVLKRHGLGRMVEDVERIYAEALARSS